MIEKNNNFIVVTIKSWILFGIVLAVTIAVSEISFATAKEGKQNGRNIIRAKPSSASIPIPQDEMNEINERLNQEGITDAEKAKLFDRAEEISKDLKKWYKSHHDKEKEKRVRKKQHLLEDILTAETIIEPFGAPLKELIPVTNLGFDVLNNSLEVSILSKNFLLDNIKEQIKIIRSIVGNEIDITLSPGGSMG